MTVSAGVVRRATGHIGEWQFQNHALVCGCRCKLQPVGGNLICIQSRISNSQIGDDAVKGAWHIVALFDGCTDDQRSCAGMNVASVDAGFCLNQLAVDIQRKCSRIAIDHSGHVIPAASDNGSICLLNKVLRRCSVRCGSEVKEAVTVEPQAVAAHGDSRVRLRDDRSPPLFHLIDVDPR